MNQVINVIFDGKVFQPETTLNLKPNQKYQLQLITELENNIADDVIESTNIIRNHQGFLNGYAPEDEGLYDEY